MGREAATPIAPIISILGSDGTFRLTVKEGTPGAEYREYETSDGKKGAKWELVYKSLSGRITNLQTFDGDYGTNLMVTMTYEGQDGEETSDIISIGLSTPFGEDFMKKLPNINLDEFVTLSPYSFEDDKGKTRKGITVKQGDTKLANFFYEAGEDGARGTNINGYPDPVGDTDKFTKDDWKIYFMTARKFLTEYTTEHFLSKFAHLTSKIKESTVQYPTDEEGKAKADKF